MFVHNNSKHGRRAKRLDPDGNTAASGPLVLASHMTAPDSTYDGWFSFHFLLNTFDRCSRLFWFGFKTSFVLAIFYYPEVERLLY